MNPSRRPIFAANWKMHKGPRETARFVATFAQLYAVRADRRVVVFPPSISLTAFRQATRERADLEAGVQDVHPEAAGAHTGAVSATMAAEAGATWGLAGHSERRREFGDDDARVGRKVQRLFEAGLQPVLCVGETLEEREGGQLQAVLARQVRTVLPELAGSLRRSLTYAYEPVWAIGTGRTASPADAAAAHGIVRRVISELTSPEVASEAMILYGGSVKPANIESLLATPGVDGVLVGGASLDPEAFAQICACQVAPAAR